MNVNFMIRRKAMLTAIILASSFATFGCKKEEEDKKFTVSVAGDGHISVTQAGPFVIKEKETLSIEVQSTSPGNDLSPEVDGDCPAGTWTDGKYTTGPIVADCTLGFAVILKLVATAGSNATVSPVGDLLTHSTKVVDYTVTAADGFFVSHIAGGTCPAGYWTDNVYHLNRLNGDCTVNFTAGTFVVTATTGIYQAAMPASSAAVNLGETVTFKLDHGNGKKASLLVEGTCPAGAWGEVNVYTTGNITEACTVIFESE